MGTSAQIAQNGCFLGKASAEDMENFRIMNPSSADLCIFPLPTSLQTIFFVFAHENMIFLFNSGQMAIFCEVATKTKARNTATPLFVGGGHVRMAKYSS